MAILRMSDINKMNEKDRENKVKELRLELIKSGITANRTNAKTREIKRTIARILTVNKINKSRTGGVEKHK